MAAMSYWLQNGMGASHMLVDMGNVDEQSVRDAADRVKAKLGRGTHVQVVSGGRVTLRVPLRHKEAATALFPEMVPGAAEYCWCSHGWRLEPSSAVTNATN